MKYIKTYKDINRKEQDEENWLLNIITVLGIGFLYLLLLFI